MFIFSLIFQQWEAYFCGYEAGIVKIRLAKCHSLTNNITQKEQNLSPFAQLYDTLSYSQETGHLLRE